MEEAKVDTTEKPLPGRATRSLGMGAGCAFAMGVPFLAFGLLCAVLAVSFLRTLGMQPQALLMPIFAVALLGAGMALSWNGSRTLLAKARADRHPDEPWRSDWSWNVAGTRAEPTQKLSVALFSLLLAPMVGGLFTYLLYYALRQDQRLPLLAKAAMAVIVIGCDWVLLLIVSGALSTIVQRIRPGRPRLQFESFPFQVGQALTVRLTAKNVMSRGPFVIILRCVEERVWTQRVGVRQETRTQAFQLYEARQNFGRVEGSDELRLVLPLPVGDYATRLSGEPPRYWELEVESGGVAMSRFLVPVY